MEPDNSGKSRDTRFQPGQSGNPAGKPKGARHKLGEAFLEALRDDFDKHGVEAVQTVRESRPQDYLKVIASLMPKDVNLNITDDTSEMSDGELAERIQRLTAAVAPFLPRGTGDAAEATGTSPASRVH